MSVLFSLIFLAVCVLVLFAALALDDAQHHEHNGGY